MSSDLSPLGQALQAYVEARLAAMTEARRGLGINEMDARALLFIAEHPGTRPTHLRDYLGITSAGVTTLIDRLVQRGAVRRDIDEVDRRVNHITATIDLFEEPWSALTRFDRDVEALIETLDDADAEAVARVLERLAGAIAGARP